ncbi:hypothetical protein OROGR_001470 [Orobanche gracilis]
MVPVRQLQSGLRNVPTVFGIFFTWQWLISTDMYHDQRVPKQLLSLYNQISGMGLGGTMGYLLGNLVSLKTLDLSNNNIHDSIPYQLPPNLTSLNLAGNNLSGNLPYSVSNMGSLTYLNISQNVLSQTVGDLFVNHSALATLDISFNNFTGDLPPSFTSLTNLSTLLVQNNQLTWSLNVLTSLPLTTLNVCPLLVLMVFVEYQVRAPVASPVRAEPVVHSTFLEYDVETSIGLTAEHVVQLLDCESISCTIIQVFMLVLWINMVRSLLLIQPALWNNEKGNVFFNVVASIHYRAESEKANDAFYRLTSTRSQIQACVSDDTQSTMLYSFVILPSSL